MTREEKKILRTLAKAGKSFKEIREEVHCADSTIWKYIQIFKNTKRILKRY